MDTAIPWALKNYMDSVTGGVTSDIVTFMPFLIIAFTVVQSAFTYTAAYLNSWVGAKISNGLKYDLFKKLLRYEAAFFDRNTSGSIQMRFNNDVDVACNGLLNHLKMFSTRIFNSLSMIIALFVISWQLAIVAVVVLALALFPLTTIRKRIEGIVAQTVFSGFRIANHYIEAFAGNRVITSYNLYDRLAAKMAKSLDFAFKLGIKMVQRSGMLSPIAHLIVGSGIAIIMWMGGYLISNGLLTAGGFVAFVTSVIMLYQPIKSLGNDLNAVQVSLMAMERVFDLLRQNPIIVAAENAVPLTCVKRSIEYKDVYFRYENGLSVLRGINLKADAGQTVALVGNSGGGKTTLVNLLPRFYDASAGQILIDGTDIRDFEPNSLRDKIAIVFQNNFLFSGTILENILSGKENATSEEIDRAVKAACLDEFIARLPAGLNTETGERGVLLSGGQKQRVAIARAFIKDAPIVIMDEATSSLDNKSEAVVQKAINNLMKDRTVFVIAHRLSTVRNADKIVVINQGQIAEIGTHEQLIAQKGVYCSLYNTQLK
jgi:subfamily B ATP-binding cassette protein MsbA